MNEFKVSSGAHWKKTSEEFWEVTRSSLPSHSMFESEVLGHPPTLLTPFTEEDDWQPAEVRTAGGRTTQRLGPQLFPISKAGLKPQFQNKGTWKSDWVPTKVIFSKINNSLPTLTQLILIKESPSEPPHQANKHLCLWVSSQSQRSLSHNLSWRLTISHFHLWWKWKGLNLIKHLPCLGHYAKYFTSFISREEILLFPFYRRGFRFKDIRSFDWAHTGDLTGAEAPSQAVWHQTWI